MLLFQRWNGSRQDLSHWSPTVNWSYIFRCCSNCIAQKSISKNNDRKLLIKWLGYTTTVFVSYSLFANMQSFTFFDLMWLALDSCEKEDTPHHSSLSRDALEVGSHVGGQIRELKQRRRQRQRRLQKTMIWLVEWGKMIVLHVRHALQ